MFDDSDPRHELWGTGEKEEEEDPDAAGEPSAQAKGPNLAGRELEWRSLGAGPGSHSGPPVRWPWGAEALPRGEGPSSGTWTTEAICLRIWPGPEASRGSSRTLCHPSFQSFYSAVSGYSHCSQPPPPGAPASSLAPEPKTGEHKTGPLPFLDCSSFFYTDPAMPPGLRIYNWLSCSSLEVLHCLQLDTPAPIMALREIPPAPGPSTRRRWLSGQELKAVSALLELPAAQSPPRAHSRAEQGDP
ncbi:histone deacetylase complex subunit SAP25 [Python bivittatus]|uniref:Histone deacetylase complex subunit SAP25 n=1 Tax=Python bivittatus TaxID=176946 RepID=A0A9F5J9G9_PYTBI|nr:histone deacetylase complex subunit SAP25 [Python bivittatus]